MIPGPDHSHCCHGQFVNVHSAGMLKPIATPPCAANAEIAPAAENSKAWECCQGMARRVFQGAHRPEEFHGLSRHVFWWRTARARRAARIEGRHIRHTGIIRDHHRGIKYYKRLHPRQKTVSCPIPGSEIVFVSTVNPARPSWSWSDSGDAGRPLPRWRHGSIKNILKMKDDSKHSQPHFGSGVAAFTVGLSP